MTRIAFIVNIISHNVSTGQLVKVFSVSFSDMFGEFLINITAVHEICAAGDDVVNDEISRDDSLGLEVKVLIHLLGIVGTLVGGCGKRSIGSLHWI